MGVIGGQNDTMILYFEKTILLVDVMRECDDYLSL